jgi:hypothetical protein
MVTSVRAIAMIVEFVANVVAIIAPARFTANRKREQERWGQGR